MSHPCSFWRKSWSCKVNYPNQNENEAGKVAAVTGGVRNPHTVGLVSHDGATVGC